MAHQRPQKSKTKLVSLGETFATSGAIEALKKAGMKEGFRLLSSCVLPKTKKKLWVITEADASGTTLLLPEEY